MRVSTSQFYATSIAQMQDQQSKLLRVQDQLGSGKRLLSAADDPVATQRIIGIEETLSRVNQFNRNADAVTSRLTIEDTLLGSASNTLQRVRELILQGKSGTLSHADRRFLATEVRARLEELVQIANGQDSNGDFLFAGYSGAEKPFLMSATGTVTFVGDQGSREIAISDERRVADADSGFHVFQDIRGGNGRFTFLPSPINTGTGVLDAGELIDPATWAGRSLDFFFTGPDTFDVHDTVAGTTLATGVTFTAGQPIDIAGVRVSLSGTPAPSDRFEVRPSRATPIFDTIQRLAQALEAGFSNPASQAAFSNAMNRSLIDLDQAMENILGVQTSVGARLAAIDAQRSINEDVKLQLATSRSGLGDLDYTEASIRLSQNMLALQSAQQAFIRTSGLNLFALL